MDVENRNNHGWIIAFLIRMLIWAFFFRDTKYEGRTAEEWFNQYDHWYEKYTSFRNCVEDYDSFDIKTKLDYSGVFYYCE